MELVTKKTVKKDFLDVEFISPLGNVLRRTLDPATDTMKLSEDGREYVLKQEGRDEIHVMRVNTFWYGVYPYTLDIDPDDPVKT